MSVTLEEVRRQAARLRPRFETLVRNLAYEPKGVLFSEMLFLWAAAACRPLRRVIESGRARGQSTELLCVLFPETPIVSIEYDAHSPDAPVADRRLRPYRNVATTFGDSRRILPRLVREGDLVLIDGPKNFRAWKLAFRLLATGRPPMVFVHDCAKDLPERRFLDTHVPEAIFTDDVEFVQTHGDLDARCRGIDGAPQHDPHDPAIQTVSYGPTLACVPRVRDSYKLLRLRLHLAQGRSRIAYRMAG